MTIVGHHGDFVGHRNLPSKEELVQQWVWLLRDFGGNAAWGTELVVKIHTIQYVSRSYLAMAYEKRLSLL